MVEPAPGLRRPVDRPGAHEWSSAVRADVLPHGRDRGRADHVAPGDRGRFAQLGLPLLVDPRRVVHPSGPLGRRLPPRSEQVLRLPRRHRRVTGPPRCRPPDHVRHRRRARPQRTRAHAPVRLARQHAGPRRQWCLEPAPARRVRRAPRCRPPTPRPTRPPRAGHPSLPRRPGRHRRRPLAGARSRHLGDPGRAPALPLLHPDVLGGARSRDRVGRPPRRARPGGPMEGHPRRDRRCDHDPRRGTTTWARSPSRSGPTSSMPRA